LANQFTRRRLIAGAAPLIAAGPLAKLALAGGNEPAELSTSATVTFQPGEGIIRIALTVDGRVEGIDADAFSAAAEAAKENCPVSKALAGVPEITLEARLRT